jgi:hypothetical protein
MNKAILISIAAAASLATAATALAQPYGAPYGTQYGAQYDQSRPYGGISHRVDYLTNRIDAARQSGSISWQEARRLRWVLSQVRSQEQSYLSQGGGLSDWQRDRLNQRLDDVAGELRN